MDILIPYVIRNEKKLKYILLLTGLVFIFFGLLRDPSWLKSINNCMAMDGTCMRAGILNITSIIITSIGCLFTLLAIRGGPIIFVNENTFELYLEFGIYILMALFLISSQMRFFGNDEFEHLHNAWLMTQGTLPYFSVTFHHWPLLEWIEIGFMSITGEKTIILQVMRLFIYCLSCGSLWLIYRISKELYQSRTHALIAVMLIISNYVWIMRTPEIRPDNLMLFFALLSFWFLIKYYQAFQTKYLFIILLCAVLSMLGKQNAAVFFLPVGLVFAYDYFINRKVGNFKILIMVIVGIGLLFVIDAVRTFFIVNIDRHIIPSAIKTSPNSFLLSALKFNPIVFALFVFQLFTTYKLPDSYKMFRYYLYAIPIVCFGFLYIMNRPLLQEMIVMVVFMSIVGSNVVVLVIRNYKLKLGYIFACIIMLPAFIYMSNTGLAKTWVKDLQTTKTILRMSNKNDLILSSFGIPIFRHSPLEPNYILYNPSRFKRLDILKKSGVKFLVVDGYTNGLPLDTRKWLYENFTPSKVDSNIWIRRND